MSHFIYRCPKCKARVEIIHKIGITKNIKCPKCKILMKPELQPVNFEIHGYSAINGYSEKEK